MTWSLYGGRHHRRSRQAPERSTHHMMTLISWGSLRLTWSLYRDLLHGPSESGTGVACLQARLETGILDCWSGAVSLADWLNLTQLQLHPGSRSIRDVTCSSGMSSSLRDVFIASGCPRRFGAAVTNLGCTSSASSVLHSSSPL